MEEIVHKYGMVVISRAGNCPEKFIYESDVLTKHKVFGLLFCFLYLCANYLHSVCIENILFASHSAFCANKLLWSMCGKHSRLCKRLNISNVV